MKTKPGTATVRRTRSAQGCPAGLRWEPRKLAFYGIGSFGGGGGGSLSVEQPGHEPATCRDSPPALV